MCHQKNASLVILVKMPQTTNRVEYEWLSKKTNLEKRAHAAIFELAATLLRPHETISIFFIRNSWRL